MLNKNFGNLIEKLLKVKTYLENDGFLSIVLFAAIITSFFNTPSWTYLDFKGIIWLLELMIIVKAFEEDSLINHISLLILNKCKKEGISIEVYFIKLSVPINYRNDFLYLSSRKLVKT